MTSQGLFDESVEAWAVDIDGVAEEFGGETAGRSHRAAREGGCLATRRVSAAG